MLNRKQAVVTDLSILGFFGQYRPLSNFHLEKVEYDGIVYPSNENAFQAAKFPKSYRSQLVTCSPMEAKNLGRRLRMSPTQRKRWDRKRIQVMVSLTLRKFGNSFELRKLLLGTGSRYLEETNDWGDNFWGVCGPGGVNALGKTLMESRSLLRYKDEINDIDEEEVLKEVQRQISANYLEQGESENG